MNDGDKDGDGIPDFADGFDFDGTGGTDDDSNTSEQFVPLVLELSDAIDLDVAEVKITYDDSDPADVTHQGTPPVYAPGEGTLRIWKNDGSEDRNKNSAKDAQNPGDYVPSDTFAASQLGLSGQTRTVTLYVEAVAASASVADLRIAVEVDPDGDGPAGFIAQDAVRVTAVNVAIKNPVNPNKGVSNDSDDYFLRGPSEDDVKVYYDFLPSGITATSVKLKIKEGGGTLKTFDQSTSSGTNLLADDWDGTEDGPDYYSKWDFRAVIEVVLEEETYTSDEHPIADLLYKHRPVVYTHADEDSPLVEVEMMMDHADLYDQSKTPDEKLEDDPLSFSDLSSNDDLKFFQDLDDNYHKDHGGDAVVYCRGTEASGHAFLQYYHFETSSCIPGDTDLWHEGDWEMFQVAVKLDTSEEEMTPIAVTASQHYYGQNIRWASEGNGPGSLDQDYVGKSSDRPQVYVALRAHATYFRAATINVDSWPPGSKANSGCQYDDGWSLKKDVTGSSACSYELRSFHDSMISHWEGKWGKDQWSPGADGPRSPKYRATAVNMWDNPKGFNNYYRKLDDYPDGDPVHEDTEIP